MNRPRLPHPIGTQKSSSYLKSSLKQAEKDLEPHRKENADAKVDAQANEKKFKTIADEKSKVHNSRVLVLDIIGRKSLRSADARESYYHLPRVLYCQAFAALQKEDAAAKKAVAQIAADAKKAETAAAKATKAAAAAAAEMAKVEALLQATIDEEVVC